MRELPVHVKLLGVNILVTEAKPSSGETSGNHPTDDGTAGIRLKSLVVLGVVQRW